MKQEQKSVELLKGEITNQVAEVVVKEVEVWIKDNIIPEIIKKLAESKEGLVSIGMKLAPVLVESLVDTLSDSFKERMESPWERSKIFKALFDW